MRHRKATAQKQLPFPFWTPVISTLSREEQAEVRQALARLFLEALGKSEEAISDE